ncbi:MAG: 3-hydroxyacyl-CoA dehydrogenase NAD-binding domain-containing protein [Achromobacter sp.]
MTAFEDRARGPLTATAVDIGHALRHWRAEQESDGLLWLTFDRADHTVNALSADVLDELDHILAYFERHIPAGMIIQSGKRTGFIVGADIDAFATLTTVQEARVLIARGWDTFDRLARAPYPTVALIRGHCLGGGLELALACRYRIVVDEPGTTLGLPEVMLGIFPAWGGMARLPALIGAPQALDLMLSGRTLTPSRASRAGVVDLRVPARVMHASARGLVSSKRRPARARGWRALTNLPPLKNLVAAQARKSVDKRDPYHHYDAPRAIIECWAEHGGNPLRAPLLIESIVNGDTARELLRVFRLRERLKGQGKQSTTARDAIRHVHVIGAGVMGGDIAAWCALKGLQVTLQDTDPVRIGAAMGRAAKLFTRRAGSPLEARNAFDRLTPDARGDGVARADLIIEAIVERVEAKQALYASLAPRMRPNAILATNTSSLSLATLRNGLAQPGRFIGIHFFNPVARMPLVEVVSDAHTETEVLQQTNQLIAALDKLPLPVSDSPGFLVNAVLAPYMLEAMRCLDEGMTPETVDAAMVAFGMPLGPIELADRVGLDVALAAGEQLSAGQPAPSALTRLTSAGHLGAKTGRGFYVWRDDKPVKVGAATPPPRLADRLLAPLTRQAQACVAAGVVSDADMADAGLIFGAGFAPFTGGPLHLHQHNQHRADKPGHTVAPTSST